MDSGKGNPKSRFVGKLNLIASGQCDAMRYAGAHAFRWREPGAYDWQ
jgi:hypothetical protein